MRENPDILIVSIIFKPGHKLIMFRARPVVTMFAKHDSIFQRVACHVPDTKDQRPKTRYQSPETRDQRPYKYKGHL
jgi:hypothetical protein